MVVRAHDAALEHRPEGLNAVRVSHVADVLTDGVLDRFVRVGDALVGDRFIRVDRGGSRRRFALDMFLRLPPM